MAKEDKEVKKIEVSEDLIRELIEQNKSKDGLIDRLTTDIEQLKANSVANANQTGLPRILKRNKDSFVGILRYNNKYFVGYENKGTEVKPLYIYKEYDEKAREQIEKCHVILVDENGKENKPLKVNYVDFLRDAEKVLVKVKQKKTDEVIQEQGTVFKKDFTDNGYGMFETTVQVPVEVISERNTYVVELENGNEIELPENVINAN